MNVRVVATAVCLNCKEPIVHEDWGNGGRLWVHRGTQSAHCSRPTRAEPSPGSVQEA